LLATFCSAVPAARQKKSHESVNNLAQSIEEICSAQFELNSVDAGVRPHRRLDSCPRGTYDYLTSRGRDRLQATTCEVFMRTRLRLGTVVAKRFSAKLPSTVDRKWDVLSV
jgi:hypothetical protein